MEVVESCACGNELRRKGKADGLVVKIRRSPCRCEKAGRGASIIASGIPNDLTEGHVNERRKLGLPLMTDLERAQFGRWV